MAFERSLVILKPDCVCRGLMGEVLARFERKGLRVVAMKMTQFTRAKAEEHYGEHKGKPFYPSLVDFITSAPVVLLSLEGVGAIEVVRKILGKTNGAQAEPGSIRGDYGISRRNNLVHASDSPASAERELKLYFDAKEFVKYEQAEMKWTYDWSGANAE